MLGTMRTMAAAGVALLTAGAAYAGGPDFKIGISLGGPVICPPVHCEPVRYRRETVCDEVPRTEVWYDSCGRRHTRIVYDKVYRTVYVPIDDCDRGVVVHHNHGWSGHGHWDRHDRDRGWDSGRHAGHDRRDGWERSGGDDRRGGDRRVAEPARLASTDRSQHATAERQEPRQAASASPAAPARAAVRPALPFQQAKVLGAGTSRELRGAEKLAARVGQANR